ncbi:MAG: hypothetical protein IPQ07_01465 [Myxococcales bacterium]|nr:hypothetical protein [Myxococcales bacterium]
MRWTAVLMLGVLAGAAMADPIATDRLLARIWDGTPPIRAEAAKALAERVAGGDQHTIDAAAAGVISDDPAVRGPLLEALITAKIIPRASAVRVPTASVLETKLGQLLPKAAPEKVPRARQCKVVGGSARAATIECATSSCGRACKHHTHTWSVTTGVRWKIEETQSRSVDDGSCGDCL